MDVMGSAVNNPEIDQQTPQVPQALIRKRELIKSSNKTLFIWVAIGSIIMSSSVVASIFFANQAIFSQKVLAEKYKSIDSLKKSETAAKLLNDNINELRADRTTLYQARASSSTNNLDVILDALPYDGDRISFGSSLQKVLLADIGVDTFSIQADDVSSDSTSTDTATSSDNPEAALEAIGNTQTIPFNFEMNGTVDQVNKALIKLRSSIRPIRITNLDIESSGTGALNVKVSAVTYYQEKKVFQLEEKTVKP